MTESPLVLSGDGVSGRRLSCLIECVPFYSVEAWMYQATQRAAELCRQHHGGVGVELFEAWAANPTALDEHPKPKTATPLADRHNDELGRSCPVPQVLQLGKSMTHFAWALHACSDLEDELDFLR